MSDERDKHWLVRQSTIRLLWRLGILALIYNNECIGIQLPPSVELQITECDPGIKGNSATSRNKPAKLETGLTVQVPEYLKQDEMIKIDTRTGDFLGRA